MPESELSLIFSVVRPVGTTLPKFGQRITMSGISHLSINLGRASSRTAWPPSLIALGQLSNAILGQIFAWMRHALFDVVAVPVLTRRGLAAQISEIGMPTLAARSAETGRI